ncbi:MAG: hypothetical protein ACRD0J_17350 [Acidimicrobiales bacterium]
MDPREMVTSLRSVGPDEIHGGLASSGWGTEIRVRAFCQCGWEGPSRPWGPGAAAAEQADLDEHLGATGHSRFPGGVPTPEGLHLACGHFHGFQGACPIPHDSPRGRLERAVQPVLGDRVAGLDRLAAIDELRAWLGEQEQQTVIGARMARATWAEMGAAVGVSRQGAWNRWGPVVKRYEQAGLLDKGPSAGLPHPPVDPTAGGLSDARNWCRWCGHRVIASPGGGGWVHHLNDGEARTEGVIEVPDCPGEEPWPSHLEWPQ